MSEATERKQPNLTLLAERLAGPERPAGERLAIVSTDKYLAEAQYFFTQSAERAQRHDEIIADLRARLGVLKEAYDGQGRELAMAMASIDARDHSIAALETDVRDARVREARALEQAGVLKGMMQTHGASIAEAVRTLGVQVPPQAAQTGQDSAQGEAGA